MILVILAAKWESTEHRQEKYGATYSKDDGGCLVVGDILHCCSKAIGGWWSIFNIFSQVEKWCQANRTTVVPCLQIVQEVIASCIKEFLSCGHGIFHLFVLLVLWKLLLLF
jgi:hypothetical protein